MVKTIPNAILTLSKIRFTHFFRKIILIVFSYKFVIGTTYENVIF
jgi:hypothetical protein